MIVFLATWVIGTEAATHVTAAPVKEPPITAKDRRHWSFQPLVRPPLPDVQGVDKVLTGLDRFVLSRLEGVGMTISPPASREVLLRRVCLDLTGLPPTEEQRKRFLEDKSGRAYENLVDRLLASTAYGERWAQHWLDLARFAESDGFEHDHVRKEAWRYRDWVIGALNADMPYDEFVRRQVAGDELYPDEADSALATGFLVAGPDMPDINLTAERRHTVLNEITSTIGSAFLGVGVGCAQCHDHKYDPVSQADFYRLRSFFSNMKLPAKNKSLEHFFSELGANAKTSHLMVRGDFRNPGPSVVPGYLRIVQVPSDRVQPKPIGKKSSGRRSELARWLTRSDHPLSLRVIANRLWMHHFNQPLVATPNDFGIQGQPPTHPALLDWLATELPLRKWSLKGMHRLMVTSATYRQASRGAGDRWERSMVLDPENRLFWRMNRRRLSGETVRDSMLLIAGRLNRKQGGPGFRPPLPREVTVTLLNNQWPVTKDPLEHDRRSIYLFARRNLRYPMFDVFDRPDALASCARRNVSTTAPQSLTLFNSSFSLERSKDLMKWVSEAVGTDVDRGITLAYQRTFARSPTIEELHAGRQFLSQQEQRLRTAAKGETTDKSYATSAFTDYCLALFNVNEFLYID